MFKNNFIRFTFLDLSTAQDREILECESHHEDLTHRLSVIQSQMQYDALYLTKQTHSIKGVLVTPQSDPSSRVEGDFLITNQPGIALGVYTADCVPIILHDTVNQAIAMCHAGWRGAVGMVACKALDAMKREYGTEPADVAVYFGPAGLSCCYEVTAEFADHLKQFSFADQLIQTRDSKLYFDQIACNRLQLIEYGVKRNAIDQSHAACTICTHQFCSARRLKNGMRQLSFALLI